MTTLSSSEPTTIQLEHIWKSFDELEVLTDVSITFEGGKFTTILGPSGSGKSTILRIIAGLLKPDKGKVWFNSEEVTLVPARERKIAMVFQNHALFPHLTVAQNTEFGLEARDIPRETRKKRVMDALKLVGLMKKRDQRPTTLSGGESQRVALARAIVTDPVAILLDEPFSSLDASMRRNLRRETKQILNQTGITSILVTHDQEEAFELSERIVLLSEGVILSTASPEQLFYHPQTESIARFIGLTNIFTPAQLTRMGLNVQWLEAQRLLEPLKGKEGKQCYLIHPNRISFKYTQKGNWIIKEHSFEGLWRRVIAHHQEDQELQIQAVIPSMFKVPKKGSMVDLVFIT